MQLQIMEKGGNLLMPYVCFHCGGRSSDLKTLENHISNEHKAVKPTFQPKRTPLVIPQPVPRAPSEYDEDEDDDDDPAAHMLLDGIVEVQIKEEPDFLVPLDLSHNRKDVASGNSIWIKQEPDLEIDHGPPINIPVPPHPLPKIRVASESVLKAPTAPPLLLKVNPHAQQAGSQPLYPYGPGGPFVNNYLKARLARDAGARRPPPPLLAIPTRPYTQTPQHIPRVPSIPRPRMPDHFPQTPYLLEVPYTCYHCGGRSQDLDTLKTHIQTMHNPEFIFRQKLALEAKKKLIASLTNNDNRVKLKIPKPPKPPKPPKQPKPPKEIKIKQEVVEKVQKIIIKVPKPFPMVERKIKEKREAAPNPNARFKCPFCSFGGNSFRGLIVHASVKHEKERAQKRLESLESMSLAERLAAGSTQKNYMYCLFCEYKSLQKNQLKKHMFAVHGKEKAHQCPYCNHKSAYGENMKWHILKHKYKCPHCNFRAVSRATLLAHEKSNCGLDFVVKNPPIIKKKRGRKPKLKFIPNYEPTTSDDAEEPMDPSVVNNTTEEERVEQNSGVHNESESPAEDANNSVRLQANGEGDSENEVPSDSQETSEVLVNNQGSKGNLKENCTDNLSNGDVNDVVIKEEPS